MKRTVCVLLAGSASLALANAASAATLFLQTHLTSGGELLSFVADANATTLTFAGYDVPSSSGVNDIRLTLQGATTNLLGSTFAFTPATCGTDSSQGPAGAYGTNNLGFAGVCSGFFDSYAQTVATSIGSTYNLLFTINASGAIDNALRVTTSTGQLAAVPEPASWTMMLAGFAVVGFTMRRQNRQSKVRFAF